MEEGWGDCFSQTFNDHVLPFIDEDDLIGRYLPTDESLDIMGERIFSGNFSAFY